MALARRNYRLNPKRERKRARESWARKSPSEKLRLHRIYKLKSKYGITPAHYRAMLEAQKGLCKLCGNLPLKGKILCIDHLHGTKTIRGLLCNNCNVLVGFVEKNIAMLEKILVHIGK